MENSVSEWRDWTGGKRELREEWMGVSHRTAHDIHHDVDHQQWKSAAVSSSESHNCKDPAVFYACCQWDGRSLGFGCRFQSETCQGARHFVCFIKLILYDPLPSVYKFKLKSQCVTESEWPTDQDMRWCKQEECRMDTSGRARDSTTHCLPCKNSWLLEKEFVGHRESNKVEKTSGKAA